MTYKNTETLRSELDKALARLKIIAAPTSFADPVWMVAGALADYLDRLQNEATSNAARLEETQKWSSICSDAYTHQQQLTHAACVSERETWSENHELKSRIRELMGANDNGCRVLMELREELDTLRNREKFLDAANQACGDQLRTAHDLITKQREVIGSLYMAKKELETEPGTSAQSSDEKAVGEVLGAILMPCQHSWRRLVAYPSGKDHQECIFCLKIEEA